MKHASLHTIRYSLVCLCLLAAGCADSLRQAPIEQVAFTGKQVLSAGWKCTHSISVTGALIGKKVISSGVLQAPEGTLIMAAGNKVFLGEEGGNVVVEVTGVPLLKAADAPAKIILAAGDTWSMAVYGRDCLFIAVDGGTGK